MDNDETHVGNNISSDIRDDTITVNNACSEKHTKLNLLYCQFSKCSRCFLYTLFNSYCMSLNGSQFVELRKYVSDGGFVYCVEGVVLDEYLKLA